VYSIHEKIKKVKNSACGSIYSFPKTLLPVLWKLKMKDRKK